MATIDDVARRAGVSASTVSYVLSGKRRISAATSRRVEQAIQELAYRPNAGARALALSRTNIIGLMAPLRVGVDVNVIMQFVAGVTQGARDREFDVLLLTQDDGTNLLRVTESSMIDALVVMDVESEDPRLPTLRALGLPVVLIGLPRDTTGLSCIDLDFQQAGSLAATHLIERGHRHVCLLGSPAEVLQRHTSYAVRMNTGFVAACDAAGVGYSIIPTTASVAGAHAAVDEMLGVMPETTAVVVHNEVALPHVIARLREHGRAVPDDVSLVAVCPENVAVSLPSPVTSIELPAEQIGRFAIEMLVARMGGGHPTEVRLLGPTLTERTSVGAPPAGTRRN